MAVILLGQLITATGTATAQANARRLSYVKATASAGASVTAVTPVSVKRATGIATGSATTVAKTPVTRKYAKGIATASATTSAKAIKYKTASGTATVTSKGEAYWTDRDISKSMSDYLPRYYDEIREAAAIIRTEANEITRIKANLNRVFDQFFVNSSDVTLDRWENLLGIKNTDGKSVEARRQLINARLRGAGTTTPGVLASVVSSFYEAEFNEITSENRVEIKLTGIRGEPDNIVDIRDAINDIIPAHIEPTFIFSYLPYSEISQAELTWGQADTYTYYELERAFLIKEES